MTHDLIAQKVAELEAWTEAEGKPLPMPAATIAKLELAGHVVDW